ncbi:heme o synthase [Notoacmeibacter ruber]|uniref:Protoheme IX farnesyltransferase n=1 Tax=Notoacmeibacter ruber TaxID=2670375 RepID=A0A3L7JAJ1_9HYPH|nr:heme o synthase [Notoacmeibacter ruber]RLQ87454.1 protoheme IX farnesyltransferase [Notoacmeibacter ruber]
MSITRDENIVEGAGLSEATPRDFFALLKPRVMSLVVFTGFVGLLLAPGSIDPFNAFVSILCIAIGAGSAGALNMWFDADIDAVMHRTANRPIPSGRVQPGEAVAFGLVMAGFSVMTLGLMINWLSAAILAFTIFYYAVLYTMWLKRSTPQNIVIGGAAGAFPPLLGWACATNTVGLEAITLFLIIFIWTPPHFWALALFKREEFDRANLPMMPNIAGEASTRRQIFAYSLLLAPLGVAPAFLGFASPVYGVFAALLGANFLRHAWAVLRMDDADRVMVPAKRLFGFSILYLFAIFAGLLVDHFAMPFYPLVGA